MRGCARSVSATGTITLLWLLLEPAAEEEEEAAVEDEALLLADAPLPSPPPQPASANSISSVARAPARDTPGRVMAAILRRDGGRSAAVAFPPRQPVLLNCSDCGARDARRLPEEPSRRCDNDRFVNPHDTPADAPATPDVIVGSGARIWRELCALPDFPSQRFIALRHDECTTHRFVPGSRVWILAYSRIPEDNLRLLAQLRDRAPRCEFIYVSSSSCIVTRVSECYEYPRVKQQAALAARQLLDARVLVLGLVHGSADDLPRGRNAATSLVMLRDFLLAPRWPTGRHTDLPLFTTVERPFSGAGEAGLHRAYGLLLRACGRFPCLLRPLDAMLRAAGIRWYGYVYLSNRLWTATS